MQKVDLLNVAISAFLDSESLSALRWDSLETIDPLEGERFSRLWTCESDLTDCTAFSRLWTCESIETSDSPRAASSGGHPGKRDAEMDGGLVGARASAPLWEDGPLQESLGTCRGAWSRVACGGVGNTGQNPRAESPTCPPGRTLQSSSPDATRCATGDVFSVGADFCCPTL